MFSSKFMEMRLEHTKYVGVIFTNKSENISQRLQTYYRNNKKHTKGTSINQQEFIKHLYIYRISRKYRIYGRWTLLPVIFIKHFRIKTNTGPVWYWSPSSTFRPHIHSLFILYAIDSSKLIPIKLRRTPSVRLQCHTVGSLTNFYLILLQLIEHKHSTTINS